MPNRALLPVSATAMVLGAALLPGLCGCTDPVRVQSFLPGPGSSFTYSVGTNSVMPPNEDGAAEVIRRDWLAQTLGAAGMCNGGYVVLRRELVVMPQRPAVAPHPARGQASSEAGQMFGNSGDVVYTGRCL